MQAVFATFAAGFHRVAVKNQYVFLVRFDGSGGVYRARARQ
ncbi:hypothetical protein NEIELOOT_00248 [Neisseria elongata subsp. glycolytica ATCC 29315]|uniref:Uncharacterized protein n=1 Tax=Neisseria elongata subsp. glycolytica ATCC 29315 TaxID=546263 RepID=D4DMI0_NEIEG|nr:hypothetical protein NEIELOOT_00248 [Neisseria elongata subsp. glycolytica ATCC 29315]